MFQCSFSVICPTGALQIENSEESDQGKYECVAVNRAGTRYSAPANLYVRGKTPAAPQMEARSTPFSRGSQASWLKNKVA